MAAKRGDGQARDFGDFVHAQAAEITKLDDAAFARVVFGQIFQGFVERQDIGRGFAGNVDGFVQRQGRFAFSAFGGGVRARVIHQNVSHQMRRDADEVCAVLPVRRLLADQLQVRFVDQRGGV